MSTEPPEPWHGAALGSGVLGTGGALLKWLWDSQGGGRLHVACAGGPTPLLGSLGSGEPRWAQDTRCSEPSWEGSALSHSLTSSKQVACDPSHLAMGLWGAVGQGGGVGVPGAAGRAGCQGPQGWPKAGVGVLPVSGHSSPVLFAVVCSSGSAHNSFPCRRFPPLSLPPIIFDTLGAQPETWGL